MSCTETGCGPERQQKETGEQGAEGTGKKNAEENPKGRRKKICRDTLRVRVYRGTNGSLRNPIKDACPCSRMTQPAIRTAAAGNPSGSSMPILMGPMDRCYGDCLRPFRPEVFLCSPGLALPGCGIIPSLHRGRRKDAQMAFSTGLTPSIGQVPYDPIPKQLSHEALDTSGKGIPASLKVHPCQADGIPTSIPCKNEGCSAAAGHPGCAKRSCRVRKKVCPSVSDSCHGR